MQGEPCADAGACVTLGLFFCWSLITVWMIVADIFFPSKYCWAQFWAVLFENDQGTLGAIFHAREHQVPLVAAP